MIVNDLGAFVSGLRYEHLPADVADAIKLRVLDLVGVALAGYDINPQRALVSLMAPSSEHGASAATVWGLGQSFRLRDAVLVNSFIAHSTYFEDGSRLAGGHPSSVVIPTAIAQAESARSTGGALIASVAAGYEVFLRLASAISPSSVERGFKSTAVVGAVASAAASANGLGLDAEASKNALAIASTLGVGLKEALAESSAEPIQVARSCEGGVLAAQFAALGARGADGILEQGFLRAFSDRPRESEILAGLGKSFRVGETHIKLHGGCRGNHAPIDLVRQLVTTHRIAPDRIEAIVIAVDSVTYAAEFHEPRDGAQAQFSVAFAVAVSLLDGDATIFRYTDARLRSADVTCMMRRIKVRADPTLDIAYPLQRGSIVEITTRDGLRYHGVIGNAKGEPESPLSREDVTDKFRRLATPVLRDRTDDMLESILHLEGLSDVGDLAAALRY